MTLDREQDKVQDVPTDIIYDPDYWENLAQQRRTQAAVCAGHPRFYSTLTRQAEELERLAQLSFKLRQDRKRSARFAVKSNDSSAEVVSLHAAAGPNK